MKGIYDQIHSFFYKIFSSKQWKFRKGYNEPHAIIALIKKWKTSVSNGDGNYFDKSSPVFIYNYLSNRKERLKVHDSFSSWSEILFENPQGLILGPLLFKIFICDKINFLVDFEIADYADGSTPFSAKHDCQSAADELEISYSILFIWLNSNYMKTNTEKSYLLLSVNNNLTANTDGNMIESKENQALPGIIIDTNFFFNKTINNLYKKATAEASCSC